METLTAQTKEVKINLKIKRFLKLSNTVQVQNLLEEQNRLIKLKKCLYSIKMMAFYKIV